MSVALFDLDHTLLHGDSDYSWGRFLVEHHRVDHELYERENQRYFDDYRAGTLDINAYLCFQLEPLARHGMDELYQWRQQFMQEKIVPIIRPWGQQCLAWHRTRGDTIAIITATNRFVTEPIARLLGVDHLIATELELVDGRFSGRPQGIPCFREGKIARLEQWLQEQGRQLEDSWFYSDSHNDLPLLNRVDHPVAVDPDATLRAHAIAQGWAVVDP
jgi:HAD superfamily hydrolase (TIGR01490 family)